MPPDTDDKDQERVTAHSYGALENTEGSTDECWMIRLPTKLAELWEAAPEGTNLGELVFTKGSSNNSNNKKDAVKPGLSVHVSESLSQQVAEAQAAATDTSTTAAKKPAVIPLNYSLQAMTKKIPVMHPFCRNPKSGTVKLMGMVSRTANLQVEQDDSYRALLKDRLVATNVTASRFVKPVEATESVLSKKSKPTTTTVVPGTSGAAASKGFGNAVLQYGKRALEASQAASIQETAVVTKKARQFAPDQPLKSVLFELFSQQAYWTVKDLKAAAVAGGATEAGTKKGESEIREVLREIGEYHRSGDRKNHWELRKEFQQQK